VSKHQTDWEERMEKYVTREDGHWLWKGTVRDGVTPVIFHEGRNWNLRRLIYERYNKRKVHGRVLVTCHLQNCIHPLHAEDRE